MEAKTIINGFDVGRWAKRDGIVQTNISRAVRSVVYLDGTLEKTEITKRHISIELVEIRDNTRRQIAAALTPRSYVNYTDKDAGDREAYFYAKMSSATERSIVGGNTYWGGIVIELEEQ